jgi:peptidoglycan LD-endopeptidase CwlK
MSFYTDILTKDPRFKAPLVCRDPALLFPPFRAKIEAVIAKLAAASQTFEIIETFRSQARQEELYAAHATQLRTVGVHGFGLACDCARMIGGRITWESGAYGNYGAACEAEGLTWGGRWTFGDLVHAQYVTVAEQPKLFNLSWYPT